MMFLSLNNDTDSHQPLENILDIMCGELVDMLTSREKCFEVFCLQLRSGFILQRGLLRLPSLRGRLNKYQSRAGIDLIVDLIEVRQRGSVGGGRFRNVAIIINNLVLRSLFAHGIIVDDSSSLLMRKRLSCLYYRFRPEIIAQSTISWSHFHLYY